MFGIRKVGAPIGDKMKLTPLNTSERFPVSIAVTLPGWGPDPVSMVKTMSVMVLLAEMRFVILTGRKMERLPVMRVPAVPPVQGMTMSPILSVIPSALTNGGTAAGAQIRPFGEGQRPEAAITSRAIKAG